MPRQAMTLMPMIAKAKLLLQSWGGIMDMTPDGSPIIDKAPDTSTASVSLIAAGATAASRRCPHPGIRLRASDGNRA